MKTKLTTTLPAASMIGTRGLWQMAFAAIAWIAIYFPYLAKSINYLDL